MNSNSTSQEPDWDLVITPSVPWWKLDLAEIWNYRELVQLLVQRDFVAYYKQTILGPLWFLIQPLLSTLVFTIIFGKIAKIPTDGLPPMLFYLSGLLAWNYFAACLSATSNTFTSNAHIFGKVYFPRLCVPISVVISNLIQFSIQSLLFIGFYLYYYFTGANIHLSIWALALPLVIFQMGLLGLGCGIIVSSVTTRYRDLAMAVGFGTQLWMYLSPIVYPVSQVPEAYRALYFLNPIVGVLEVFRKGLLGVGQVDIGHLAIGWGMTLFLFICGVILFRKVERIFMDSV
jgi:lipopolysaccharide transport system permease protein